MAEVADAYGQSVTETSLPSALAEYAAANLDYDHSFIADRVLRGAIRNLVEDCEHYKAVKAAEKWYDWFADVGERQN